jgi:hypothetical protein
MELVPELTIEEKCYKNYTFLPSSQARRHDFVIGAANLVGFI